MGIIQLISLNLVMASLINGFELSIDLQKIYRVVNPKFVNVAMDTSLARDHWENFDPKSTKVRTLAAGLAPSYLRVGGTGADFLIFQNDKASSGKLAGRHGNDIDHMQMKQLMKDSLTRSWKRNHSDVGNWNIAETLANFTMTASFYDELHEFVKSAGWDLIFDLNSLMRKPNGVWDPTNAIQLINYTAESGYKMGGWELGNEPDEYTDVVIRHKLIPPEQLSKDFATLRDIVRSYPSFRDCQILGPSIAAMSNYWRKGFFYSFMSSGGGDVVTAATFHQYYEDGAVAKVEDFYNPAYLNILYEEIQSGVNLTRAAGSKANVWLGETSATWRTGAPNISDRYVAAFMWLDKLGMSARDGIDGVVRQTFYCGNYSLIDHDTLDPNPDYWLTLLYKMLVGNKVLRVISPHSTGMWRAYAHCTNTLKSGYPPGSVTVYVMNLGESSTTVELSTFYGRELHVYHMSPPDNDLLSQSVMLNGKLLQMVDEKTLPDLLHPRITKDYVNLDARTYSFIVIPDAKLSICM